MRLGTELMTLSNHLAELGLTQAQFGRLIKLHSPKGVGRGTINRWISGKGKNHRETPQLAYVVVSLLKRLNEPDPQAIEDDLSIAPRLEDKGA